MLNISLPAELLKKYWRTTLSGETTSTLLLFLVPPAVTDAVANGTLVSEAAVTEVPLTLLVASLTAEDTGDTVMLKDSALHITCTELPTDTSS